MTRIYKWVQKYQNRIIILIILLLSGVTVTIDGFTITHFFSGSAFVLSFFTYIDKLIVDNSKTKYLSSFFVSEVSPKIRNYEEYMKNCAEGTEEKKIEILADFNNINWIIKEKMAYVYYEDENLYNNILDDFVEMSEIMSFDKACDDGSLEIKNLYKSILNKLEIKI